MGITKYTASAEKNWGIHGMTYQEEGHTILRFRLGAVKATKLGRRDPELPNSA